MNGGTMMKKTIRRTLALICCAALSVAAGLAMQGCSPLEVNVRNTIAANYGAITYARAQFTTSCQANPSQTICQLVDKDIPLHNALIDALESYCGGTPASGQQPFASGGPCAPVSGLAQALQAALSALLPVLQDIEPLLPPATIALPATAKPAPPTPQQPLRPTGADDYALLEYARL
jgi:hypothetical protein